MLIFDTTIEAMKVNMVHLMIEKKFTQRVVGFDNADQELEARFGIPKEALISVVQEALAAFNSTTPMHRPSAGRIKAFEDGLGALRSMLLRFGYEPFTDGQVHGAYHPERNLRVFYQNTDTACQSELPICPRPKNRGKNLQRTITNKDLKNRCFPFEEYEEKVVETIRRIAQDDEPQSWFLCAAFDGFSWAAELSRPSDLDVSTGQFVDMEERIFLGYGSEESGDIVERPMDNAPLSDDGSKVNADVEITRKRRDV